MRKLVIMMAAAAFVGGMHLSLATRAWADGADEYDDSQAHPLRIAAYLLHPIGYTLEWLVTRPFHELVAQPDLEPVFGHTSHQYYGDDPVGAAIVAPHHHD